MKKCILSIVVVLVLCSICGSSIAEGQEADQAGKETKMKTPQYSALALELIEAYTPPKRIAGRPQPAALLPPPLSPKHWETRYRSAWQELLHTLVADPLRDMRVGRMGDRIVQAFVCMQDPETVPALRDAFKRTVSKDVEQVDVIHRQEDILQALVTICETNALEAILSSLDLVDEAYGNKEPELTADGLTLREKTFRLMLQPDNPGKSELQRKGIEKAKRWQSLFHGYQNPKLSLKNRELLDKAKGFKRSEKRK